MIRIEYLYSREYEVKKRRNTETETVTIIVPKGSVGMLTDLANRLQGINASLWRKRLQILLHKAVKRK